MITGRAQRLQKITKTGEIVQCKGSSGETFLSDVESASGKHSKIPSRELSDEVTPEEEYKFDLSRNQPSN